MPTITARAPDDPTSSPIIQDGSGANPAIHGAGGDPKTALGAGPDPVAVSPVEVSIIVVTVVVFLFGMLLVLWCHQRKKATGVSSRHRTSGSTDLETGVSGMPLQHKDARIDTYPLSPLESKNIGPHLHIHKDRGAKLSLFDRKELTRPNIRPESSMEEHKDHYDPTKDNT
ncbi:hypothetical protein BROUX41_002791 [Berkeleyomyces rouxiae]|uniref:uncharacterized protein n=1 Tax=Berkeleyomyces rouxiae TaxID=2035830 RepID=UPI003B798BE0